MSNLSAKHFHSEKAAFAYVEARVWPEGPICPHCAKDGVVSRKIGLMKGKSTRQGLYKCYDCRKPFTVRIGTIFESSHLPLRVWLQAMFLMASSKKGISANQISRTLSVTVKTAWFLMHRIRLAMDSNSVTPFGLDGGMVEVDETYIGQNPDAPASRLAIRNMNAVLTLVDRDSGRARSMVVDHLTTAAVAEILRENMAPQATLMTDEGKFYKVPGKGFAAHHSVSHTKGEYVSRENNQIHSNTVEGFFSIFKRGMRGVYQHAAKRHLHRYLAEFDFRYSNRVALGVNDTNRADRILAGVVGKRLTYAATSGAA